MLTLVAVLILVLVNRSSPGGPGPETAVSCPRLRECRRVIRGHLNLQVI